MPTQRELLDRFVVAFENKDITAIVDLFATDAIWEMPPFIGWYQGAENIGRLVDTQCPAQGPGDMRLIETSANGQPAFGLYMRGEDGSYIAVQPAGPRRSGRTASPTSPASSTSACSRSSGCPRHYRRCVAMSENAALVGAVSLLERSIAYLLGNLQIVRARR